VRANADIVDRRPSASHHLRTAAYVVATVTLWVAAIVLALVATSAVVKLLQTGVATFVLATLLVLAFLGFLAFGTPAVVRRLDTAVYISGAATIWATAVIVALAASLFGPLAVAGAAGLVVALLLVLAFSAVVAVRAARFVRREPAAGTLTVAVTVVAVFAGLHSLGVGQGLGGCDGCPVCQSPVERDESPSVFVDAWAEVCAPGVKAFGANSMDYWKTARDTCEGQRVADMAGLLGTAYTPQDVALGYSQWMRDVYWGTSDEAKLRAVNAGCVQGFSDG